MEGFENSSFTRPSGGVFDVKLAQNSKNEKVVCGSLLEVNRPANRVRKKNQVSFVAVVK